MFAAIWGWIRSLFFNKELEIVILGLQASGKTSLVHVLADGEFLEEVVPTIGFNLRKVSKGKCNLRIFDVSGQESFRSSWTRYASGANAILFIVDSSDPSTFPLARAELHALVGQSSLRGIPILVLANKSDLSPHSSVEELIAVLDLRTIIDRELSIYAISVKEQKNLDLTLHWLLTKA